MMNANGLQRGKGVKLVFIPSVEKLVLLTIIYDIYLKIFVLSSHALVMATFPRFPCFCVISPSNPPKIAI